MTEIKKKILIVDDLPSNVKLLDTKISNLSYEVLKAFSGKEAIKIAIQYMPDLILMDIMMPDMDGNETSIAIKSNRLLAHIPIIFVTSLDNEEDRLKALVSGGNFVITKPINDIELEYTIKNLLSCKTNSLELNRQSISVHIHSLLSALTENIECVKKRNNKPPSFDLMLHENDDLLRLVEQLINLLRTTNSLLEDKKRSIISVKSSLPKDALREFVMKLSGELGTGVAKSITWGARLFFCYSVYNLQKDFGFKLEDIQEEIAKIIHTNKL